MTEAMAAGAPRTFATIDVGTNTTLLLVAEVAIAADGRETIRVVDERAEITRLGRGIGGGGPLGSEGIERTLAALQAYVDLARGHGATIVAVGTEALRRAPNAAAFVEPAAKILGAPIEIIDGGREAALTFRAVSAAFPDAARGTLAAVDIGGGSTEIILARGGQVAYQVSLPMGSVRFTERFLRHDPPTDDEIAAALRAIDAQLASSPLPLPSPLPFSATPVTLVGVAGTVTSLAAMAESMATYDSARVHGYRLTRAALDAQIARLGRATPAERQRMVGLDPRRADVILAGALILDRIARAARVSDILVSDRGVRWGLLHEIAHDRAP